MKLLGLLIAGTALSSMLYNWSDEPAASRADELATAVIVPDSDRTRELFRAELADMFYVEQRLVDELAALSTKAQSRELREGFARHAHETQGQVERLQQVYMLLGHAAEKKTCEGLDGLLKEADEMVKAYADDPLQDVVMITGARKVEHYETVAYEALIDLARRMGKTDVLPMLEANLKEERSSDEALARLAEKLGPRTAQAR